METGAVIKHNLKKAPITGYWRYAKPVVDKKKCAGCGACVKYCPEAVIELEAHNSQHKTLNEIDKSVELRAAGVAIINYCFCKGCGVCAAVCPQKAIAMEKESSSNKYQVE